MDLFHPMVLLPIFAALAMGGTLKGATGMGAPLMAIPVMASYFDVRFAVVVMVVPSLLTNIWQLWRYRQHLLPQGFSWLNAGGAAVGGLIGTVLLAKLPVDFLSAVVAGAVVLYVLLRIAKPEFKLQFPAALRLSAPIGVLAGALQGASGISAPVSVSFLSAMRLTREVFVATISASFIAISLAQIPPLAGYGLLTPHMALLSLLATAPLLLFMPVGEALARHISPRAFDRIILAILILLALKLVVSSF